MPDPSTAPAPLDAPHDSDDLQGPETPDDLQDPGDPADQQDPAEPDPDQPEIDGPAELTEETRAALAVAARARLLQAAATYNATITHKELGQHVQDETGLRPRQMTHYWIADVLSRVARVCDERDEPLLSALAVNAKGSVGPGYPADVTAIRGEEPADGDDHAAAERLACYRHFGATVPAGGGSPALTKQLASVRDRARKVRIAEKVPELCPVHHITLSGSGVCDYCE